jgi:hypothetical protein
VSSYLKANLSQHHFNWHASHLSLTQSGLVDRTAACGLQLNLSRNSTLFPSIDGGENGSLEELSRKKVWQNNIFALLKAMVSWASTSNELLSIVTSARVNERLFQPDSSIGKSFELGLYGRKETCNNHNQSINGLG